MRVYWEILTLSIRRQITYRTATLAGLATNFFFGLLRAAVLIALYGARQEVAGISLRQAVTYTAVTQAIIAYLALFSWYDLMRSVYTGQVGADLLRPMSFIGFWMAQDLGRALVTLIFRGLIIVLAYTLFFPIVIPSSTGQWLALLAALLLAWLVSFAWRFLLNLVAFWVPNALGIGRIAFGLAWFTSGFLMPMRFMPAWFVQLCYLTPFPQMVNTIVEIYLGLVPKPDVFGVLINQALWAAALLAAGQLALRAGVRRLVIQGG